MKKIIAICICLSFVFIMTSCGVSRMQPNMDSTEKKTDEADTVKTEKKTDQFGSAKVYGLASFNSNVFSDTIPELFEKSDAVILGTVVRDSEANVSEHGITYPLTDVEIERVWKGDLAAGDVITFSQTGERHEKGYDFSIGGEPLGRNGDRMILFLFSNDVNDLYGVTGCFQGKFFVGDDNNVYAYEYFSEEYAEWYFSDVGAVTPYDEFVSILDSAK